MSSSSREPRSRGAVDRARPFKHPLLRIAVLPDQARGFREVNRAIRTSLDQSLARGVRVQAAIRTLGKVDSLGLAERVVNDFLTEWLQAVAPQLDDIYIWEAMAHACIHDCGLTLKPRPWLERQGLCKELPRLMTLKMLPFEAQPPLTQEVDFALSKGVQAIYQSLEDASVEHWGPFELFTALRVLVLHSILPPPFALSHLDSRLEFWNGQGMGLWQNLIQRAQACGLENVEAMAVGIPRKIKMHLEGLAAYAQTKVDTGTAANVQAGSTPEIIQPAKPSVSGPEQPMLVVVTQPIPPCTDKAESDQLRMFELLRHPVPVAKMLSRAKLQAVIETLTNEFPWAQEAVAKIDEILTPPCLLGVRELTMRPVLLVGPPGSGKSRLCRRLAQELGLPYMPVAVGGASDSKALLATSRGWASASPSPIIKLMLANRTASVFVMLDEIDKANGGAANAPPLTNALLGLLEPETSKRFRDGYLQAMCDLSRVVFWATANDIRQVPAPLLSRFDVVTVPHPRREHMPELGRNIVREMEAEWKLPAGTLPQLPDHFWNDKPVSARLARRLVSIYMAMWAQQELRPEAMH